MSLTWGRDFSTQPCDINAVWSSTHTLDLIFAVTLKLHHAHGLTAFSSAGLPYALSQAGLPFGLLLLVVVAFITGGCAGEKKNTLASAYVKSSRWSPVTPLFSHHGRLLNNFADQRREPVRDEQLPVTGAEHVWHPRFPGFIYSAVPLPFYW